MINKILWKIYRWKILTIGLFFFIYGAAYISYGFMMKVAFNSTEEDPNIALVLIGILYRNSDDVKELIYFFSIFN